MIKIMSGPFQHFIAKVATQRRHLEPGTFLFHQGDRVQSVHFVESGLIELTRHQKDGLSIVLQRATDNDIVAEASVYSEVYHCDAIVALPSSIFEISKAQFRRQLNKDESLADMWAEHLAKEVQSARYRSEIMAHKTVSDRLDGWLAWRGGELPAKGHWKSVASQIGVSPEALYRELSRRRK